MRISEKSGIINISTYGRSKGFHLIMIYDIIAYLLAVVNLFGKII
jgi:hypothetical protein